MLILYTTQVLKVGLLKDSDSQLLVHLPFFIEKAQLVANQTGRGFQEFSCGSKVFTLNVPLNSRPAEIMLGSFIPSDQGKSEATFVIIEENDDVYRQILELHDRHGDLLLREIDKSSKYMAIDRSWNAIYFFDREHGIGGACVSSLNGISLGAFITPIRTIVSWFLDIFSTELVHASAIGINGTGVMISGASGRGKSTTALYAATHGHQILGDDAVLVADGMVSALYKNAKFSLEDSRINLKGFNKVYLEPRSEKGILPLVDNNFDFIKSIPLDLLILPEISNAPGFFELGKAAAVKEFVPQSMKEVLGGTQNNVQNLLKIVKETPCFRLFLSGDMETDFANLLELVDRK